jgi:hypothetical protein
MEYSLENRGNPMNPSHVNLANNYDNLIERVLPDPGCPYGIA